MFLIFSTNCSRFARLNFCTHGLKTRNDNSCSYLLQMFNEKRIVIPLISAPLNPPLTLIEYLIFFFSFYFIYFSFRLWQLLFIFWLQCYSLWLWIFLIENPEMLSISIKSTFYTTRAFYLYLMTLLYINIQEYNCDCLIGALYLILIPCYSLVCC